jgi:hypothetical protein
MSRTRREGALLGLCIVSAALLSVAAAAAYGADAAALTATEILKATGVRGGFIVHLGCGDGRMEDKGCALPQKLPKKSLHPLSLMA